MQGACKGWKKAGITGLLDARWHYYKLSTEDPFQPIYKKWSCEHVILYEPVNLSVIKVEKLWVYKNTKINACSP